MTSPTEAGDVTVHVGYPKTATTALQWDVFQRCRQAYYLGTYPRSSEAYARLSGEYAVEGLGATLHDLCTDGEAFHRDLDRHRKRLASIHARRLLLSHEGIVNAHYPRVPVERTADNIKALFPDRRVRVLITIRCQDELAESLYNEHYMKAYRNDNSLNTLRKFMDRAVMAEHGGENRFDFRSTIGGYVDAFGRDNVTVMVHEHLRSAPRDFLCALARFLDEPDLPGDVREIAQRNVRFTSGRAHHYTLWNVVHDLKYPYLIARKLLPASWITRLGDALRTVRLRNVRDNDFRLTEEQRRDIRRHFAPGNRALARQFGLDLERHGYFR